jgi:hypothetical protein
VKLANVKLTTRVGSRQRFNPAVVAEGRGLTNVKLYIDFAGPVEVEPSRAWKPQSRRTFMADLGDINSGTFINAFEAVHFKAVAVGTLRFAYLISALEVQPKSGVIQIEVVP